MNPFELPASLLRSLARLKARNQHRADTFDPLAGYVDMPRWMMNKPTADRLALPRTILGDEVRMRGEKAR